MDKDEALQMCLEYIETDAHERKHVRHAIKAALTQPAQEPYDQTALELCEVCGWKTLIPDDGCLNCERAQPAQEPVAWRVNPRYEDSDGFFDFTDSNETAKELESRGWSTTPLYTAPPKRPWVGLTDEERNDCLVKADPCECLADPEAFQLMDEVEAVLKGKNNG